MSHARPALSGSPPSLSQPSVPQPRVSPEVLGPRGFLHGVPPF